mgnify:CR=1 FL=1
MINTNFDEWGKIRHLNPENGSATPAIAKSMIGAYMENTFDNGMGDDFGPSREFETFEGFYVGQVRGTLYWLECFECHSSSVSEKTADRAEKVRCWLLKEEANPHPEKYGHSWAHFDSAVSENECEEGE